MITFARLALAALLLRPQDLQLSEALLVDVGVPMGPVIASIHERRDALQVSIKAMAPAAEVRVMGRRRMRDER
jgi:CPA2 family monovalent cation:H+ antiporter-2